MENKIYQECREEAKCILAEKRDKEGALMFSREDLDQLTAELYAQKFADWTQPVKQNETWYIRTGKEWEDSETFTHIGTTAQLHSKFVEENKGGDDEN